MKYDEIITLREEFIGLSKKFNEKDLNGTA